MERLFCPACASSAGRDAYDVKGFRIRKCACCGSLYVRNVPGRSSLDQIYLDQEYYSLEDQSVQRLLEEHRRRLGIIQRFSRPGRVLDVGCATGLFLDEAAEAGYETFGIELSPRNAALAQGKGHKVFVGPLAKYVLSNPRDRFSLITCLDVIEHVESPLNFMQMLLAQLSVNGMLVISTPNYSGVVAKVLGERDVFLMPPEHLNFFTFAGLLSLAKDAGLSPVYETTFGRLTRNELDRAIARYFPRMVRPASPLLRAVIRAGFGALNSVRLGLEIEMYFSSTGSFK